MSDPAKLNRDELFAYLRALRQEINRAVMEVERLKAVRVEVVANLLALGAMKLDIAIDANLQPAAVTALARAAERRGLLKPDRQHEPTEHTIADEATRRKV